MRLILNAISSRAAFIRPVLVGLSAAYALAGLAEYRSSFHTIPSMQTTAVSVGIERPSLKGIIFEKNILGLEVPFEAQFPSAPKPLPELENWRLMGDRSPAGATWRWCP